MLIQARLFLNNINTVDPNLSSAGIKKGKKKLGLHEKSVEITRLQLKLPLLKSRKDPTMQKSHS